ncbi:hypothetical protein BS50DRAFT_567434 [Corynespora cassiicola Philippines]|uniref:Uncharacterized protein n=1 Tax=Corynespora cassiicola Philippines TaxID=1448308 RepID=A0A2T2PAE9_CORCC|nr:hypothetical protein BS50DRAFT_567434 [Corynespora cassiicola Philippines]
MQFPFSLAAAALALSSTGLAFPYLVPRTNITNTCWTRDPVCLGYQADAVNASITIVNACAKVPTCTPGEKNHGRKKVTGIVKSFPYTATLYIGDNCAGVEQWSQEACQALFQWRIDDICEQAYPKGESLYQLGYNSAVCDTSSVSFNFGG